MTYILALILVGYILHLRRQRRAALNALAPALLVGRATGRHPDEKSAAAFLHVLQHSLSKTDYKLLSSILCKAYGLKRSKAPVLNHTEKGHIAERLSGEIIACKQMVTEQINGL